MTINHRILDICTRYQYNGQNESRIEWYEPINKQIIVL